MSAQEAISMIKDGDKIGVGGFIGMGHPQELSVGVNGFIAGLEDSFWKNASPNSLEKSLVKKLTSCHVSSLPTGFSQY